ncbi:hypothetical protein AAVH_11317, partial [Aphelenchoides avenae]
KVRLLTAARKEAMRRPEVRTSELLTAVLSGVPDEVQTTLPRRTAIKRMIQRARKRAQGSSTDGRPTHARRRRPSKLLRAARADQLRTRQT